MAGFTEFCCRSGGSNMNGGALSTNAEPATTAAYSATNGGWNSGTGVFTPTSGNPSSSVNVGDYAHVFTDGSTTPTFIGRVTATSSTTLTVSTTIKTGTAPTTSGTGISVNVGGAWAGPSGTSGFPLTFVDGVTVAGGTDRMRVNMKNDQTYSVTAQMTVSPSSGSCAVTFQGYSSTFGDGGRATIDGGTSGTAYTVMVLGNNSGYSQWTDLIFDHNGATSSAALVDLYRYVGIGFFRCTFRNSKGSGVIASFASNPAVFVECEAYSNGSNGFGNMGAFYRCIASKNTNHGFTSGPSSTSYYIDCISVGNSNIGFQGDQASCVYLGCDSVNNTASGYFFGWGTNNQYINCNAIKNGTYGFLGFSSSRAASGALINCGFGGGGYANTSGATSVMQGMTEIGSINYSTHPYVDPDNGDFRISASAAKGTGFGNYIWNDTNYSARANNIAYPDVGAVQHQESASTSPVGQLKQFNRGTPY